PPRHRGDRRRLHPREPRRVAALGRHHHDHRGGGRDGAPALARGRDLLRHLDGLQRRRRAEARPPPAGARLGRHDGERHGPALLHDRALRRVETRRGPGARAPDGRADAPRARPSPGALGGAHLNPREYDFVAARRRIEAKAKSAGAKLTTLEDAVAMGVPFLPALTMLGSDLMTVGGMKTLRDPYTGETLAAVPALFPDVSVLHVHRADMFGNCQIDGYPNMEADIAGAATTVLVT